MVDIIRAADAVLQVHIVINRSNDVFSGNVLRNQVMDPVLQLLCQFISGQSLSEDLHQHRIINQLVDSQVLQRILVHIEVAACIHHHVGQNLAVLPLGLNHDIGHACILDVGSALSGENRACLGDDLAGFGIDHILCQGMAGQAAAEVKLLIKLITADLCQVIALRVEEHAV